MEQMIKERNDYIFPFHRSLNVVDATKIKCYATCARMFFYEYVLGWRKESHDLAFGGAFHKALEVLYLNWHRLKSVGSYDEILSAMVTGGRDLEQSAIDLIEQSALDDGILAEAFHEFLTEYQKLGYGESVRDDRDIYQPKTIGKAALAIMAYAENYKDERFELLELDRKPSIEMNGTVILNTDFYAAFRLDTIIRKEIIKVREHKTGKTFYNWTNQWELDIQIGMYSFILFMMFGDYNNHVEVDGVLFNTYKPVKKNDAANPYRHINLQKVEVVYNEERLEAWYASTLNKLYAMRRDFDLLITETPTTAAMQSFQRCEIQCHSHYGKPCMYFDFCNMWGNPLKQLENDPDFTPIGFNKDYWNPLEKAAKVNLSISAPID